MRTFFSVFLGLVFLAVLGGIGAAIYNAGVTAGLAQAGTVVVGGGPYLYGWGFPGGFGFSFLGLLFPIFFLFVIFGLLRAAIGGGRRGWNHGWHDGRGMDGWRSDRERYMADLHRRFHEADGTGAGDGGASGTGADGGSAR